jgi:hypothetical protein
VSTYIIAVEFACSDELGAVDENVIVMVDASAVIVFSLLMSSLTLVIKVLNVSVRTRLVMIAICYLLLLSSFNHHEFHVL